MYNLLTRPFGFPFSSPSARPIYNVFCVCVCVSLWTFYETRTADKNSWNRCFVRFSDFMFASISISMSIVTASATAATFTRPKHANTIGNGNALRLRRPRRRRRRLPNLNAKHRTCVETNHIFISFGIFFQLKMIPSGVPVCVGTRKSQLRVCQYLLIPSSSARTLPLSLFLCQTPAESTHTRTQTHLFRLILFMDVLSAAKLNKIMLCYGCAVCGCTHP